MDFSFGSQLDDKGCKLTSSGVAVCQSFSCLSGGGEGGASITEVPSRRVTLQAKSGVISPVITQIAQRVARTQWSRKCSPPTMFLLSFPFLPSFRDEEWNAPQRVAFFSSRGNWESRRGPLWCYFPFRVGRRCLVAQLKMIIWEWNKVPLWKSQRYAESQGPS